MNHRYALLFHLSHGPLKGRIYAGNYKTVCDVFLRKQTLTMVVYFSGVTNVPCGYRSSLQQADSLVPQRLGGFANLSTKPQLGKVNEKDGHYDVKSICLG